MNYIRDGVHNYIAISSFEEHLLNHPTVFRLNRVLQNSTFFHTYPFNRGSRFIHSIGTMHVAGKLCEHIFRNTSQSIIKEVVEKLAILFQDYWHIRAGYLARANNYIYSIQNDEDDDLFDTLGWQVEEVRNENTPIEDILTPALAKNLLYQGVRLAALVHDIGHPPYSHVVEFAYEDLEALSVSFPTKKFSDTLRKLNKEYNDIIQSRTFSSIETPEGKLHERIGLILINRIYHWLYSDGENKQGKEFFELSLSICVFLIAIEQHEHYLKDGLALTMASNPAISKLYPFASIISGPVDSDRLDYLVRDAVNSAATEFIGFDHEKIIQNISLAKYPNSNRGTERHKTWPKEVYKDNLLLPVFHRRVYSPLEDFFYSKMHEFRWLIGHHNVVRTDIALSRTIFILSLIFNDYPVLSYFEITDGEATKINQFLRENDFSLLINFATPADSVDEKSESREVKLLEMYRYIDDAWLDTFLQKLYRFLVKEQVEADFSPIIKRLIEFLKILYERKTEYLQAIWKREDGFEYFAGGFVKELSKNKKAIDAWAKKHSGFPQKNFKYRQILDLLDKKKISDLETTESSSHLIRGVNHILHAWKKDTGELKSPYTSLMVIEKKLNDQYGDNNQVVFCLKKYSPYEQVNIIVNEENGEELRTLESISQITRKLSEIIGGQLQLYAFDYSGQQGEWAPSKIRTLGGRVCRIILSDIRILK